MPTPTLRPALGRPNPRALAMRESMCNRLQSLPEDAASQAVFGLVQMLEADSDKVTAINTALECRTWTSAARTNLIQLRNRHSGTATSSTTGSTDPTCNCKKPKPDMYTSPSNPANFHGWQNKCGVYHAAGADDIVELIRDGCEGLICEAGHSIGLVRIPYEQTLAPGATVDITHGFTRDATLVGLSFVRNRRPSSNYNPDDWSIGNWTTDSQIQAFDIARRQTTFSGVNPTDTFMPLTQFFEDGDDSASPMLHGESKMPQFFGRHNIGANDGIAGYTLALDALAPGNQTAFWYAYIVFVSQRSSTKVANG